jgi:hypothetical protein
MLAVHLRCACSLGSKNGKRKESILAMILASKLLCDIFDWRYFALPVARLTMRIGR